MVKLSFYRLGLSTHFKAWVKRLFTIISVKLMFSILLFSVFMVFFSMILQWTSRLAFYTHSVDYLGWESR